MYTQSLFWSVGACVATRLMLSGSSKGKGSVVSDADGLGKAAVVDAGKRREFKAFQRSFLTVALLAMFSDWIQGPYSYALYAYYGFEQGDIAMLYMGGFLSSMVAGSFVGALADNYGRKKMCVMYAVFYAISCLVKLVNNYYILMFGRFFAGIATSLLFSSFEAWMVCEHNKRGFEGAWLSETFGYLTLGNGFVAVVAGLVANFFAERYGYIGPFVFCLFPLSLVAVLAAAWWPENYGDSNLRPEMALPKAWSYIRSNSSIIYLGLGQSCFEGAMYAFVFVWTPALQAGGQDVGPYLGIIFSTFMVCTMTGSNLFSLLTARNLLPIVPVVVHAIATLANLTAFTMIKQTLPVYLAFLLFELTVGMFYPSYGSIKSQNIPEEVRSGVMNIFRIPLNAIMVVLLGLIEVKGISMGTTLALCTLIHGAGLFMYLSFERHRKHLASDGGYSPVSLTSSEGGNGGAGTDHDDSSL